MAQYPAQDEDCEWQVLFPLQNHKFILAKGSNRRMKENTIVRRIEMEDVSIVQGKLGQSRTFGGREVILHVQHVGDFLDLW